MKFHSKELKRSVVAAIILMFILGCIGSLGFEPGLLIDRVMIRSLGEEDFCLLAYHDDYMRGRSTPQYCRKYLFKY